MSERNLSPEQNDDPRELDEPRFDEEAESARRRQYLYVAAAVAAITLAVFAIPWKEHVKAGGRIAPQRWAKVRAEAPGVVREVTHKVGDAMEEGDIIAVLDFDEQRDALEAARLAVPRGRQKLADLELRQRENQIQREGADALAKSAGERAIGAQRIDGSRLAALEPVADAALRGVRRFTAGVRAELAKNRSELDSTQSSFDGESLYRGVQEAMARYSERAAAVSDQLTQVAGIDAGRQFNFELEDLRFAYDLADHSMEEILMKMQLVQRGFLAPVALRAPCAELERKAMELTHSFRALSSSARTTLGTPSEQSERVRGAEETQRLLANEAERLEAERSSVSSEIAAAELAVRSAERHQGKTVIRAPIRGTLAGEALSQFDAVSANASLGVVEDASRLVLKVDAPAEDFRRIKVGQPVEFTAPDGTARSGVVAWKTPVAGQAVRDQAWNVLIQVNGSSAGFDLGDQLIVSVDVGRRSMFARWLAPASEAVPLPRVALVEDPTELRRPAAEQRGSVAAVHEAAASSRSAARPAADGS